MAQDIKVTTTCDPCDLHDLRGVTAVATHVLAIDGGPLKKIDVCPRDEVLFQEFLHLYTVSGREEPTTPPAPAKKRQAKAVEAPQQKELGTAPASQPDAKKKPVKEKVHVLCPLPHPSTGGTPMRVDYSNRSTHAQMVHNGAHVWEIKWEDPDGVLKAFCTEHAACNGIGFTKKAGLSQHIVAMRGKIPVVRDAGESDGQAEGP